MLILSKIKLLFGSEKFQRKHFLQFFNSYSFLLIRRIKISGDKKNVKILWLLKRSYEYFVNVSFTSGEFWAKFTVYYKIKLIFINATIKIKKSNAMISIFSNFILLILNIKCSGNKKLHVFLIIYFCFYNTFYRYRNKKYSA